MDHPYRRTAIRRVSVRNFRSIRLLERDDIPDLVVLHGPNGAGKSNILAATQLPLRAAALSGALPLGHDRAIRLSLDRADEMLGLRPEDFHHGASPEIRITIEVTLGTRAERTLQVPEGTSLGSLTLTLVVQLVSDVEMSYWFDQAYLGDAPLLETSDPENNTRVQRLHELQRQIDHQKRVVVGEENVLADLEARGESTELFTSRSRLRGQTTALRRLESELNNLESQLDAPTLRAERLRSELLKRRLLLVTQPYRVFGSKEDPQLALYRASLSYDRNQRDAVPRLGRLLGTVGLFGAGHESIELKPMLTPYGEQVIFLKHPTQGDVTIRNLGSGEQQIVYMLTQLVVTSNPIVFFEEPEAHLHTKLMEKFGHVLLEGLRDEDNNEPEIDQLWIATHHHHFALALNYLDVELKNGATEVEWQPRAKAARHFYEPGPIWEALRQLAHSAKTRDSVVFRGMDRQPVTAGQILDSLEKDPEHVARVKG